MKMRGKILHTLCLWYILIKNTTTFALKFPDNFVFGVSTASYQTEGAWNVDGKGESIWDRFAHTNPDKPTGDDATQSYYFYEDDIDLVKKIGFDLYRFSISWTRILPNGDLSKINQAGIQHYNNVINYALGKNITPMVTMYHWDLPQKLQEAGGWLNPITVDDMERYADILFQNFGDRVKWWITINEPYMIAKGYCCNNTYAPALGLGSPADYVASHHSLLAHMRIYRLYEKKYKAQQNGKLSIALNFDTCYPKTQSPEDIAAAERDFEFKLGMYAHPIYSADGDYPKLLREIVDNNSKADGLNISRLPIFTEEEKLSLRGTYDFFALTHYTSYLCSPSPSYLFGTNTKPYQRDENVISERDPSLFRNNLTEMPVHPEGFRFVLNLISKKYNHPTIFVTENGYGEDCYSTNDTTRIQYHRNYLYQLLLAINEDFCKIIGYAVWSLLDNLEWHEGYAFRFGVVSVDFNSTNKVRTRKQSSYFFQSLIANRTLP